MLCHALALVVTILTASWVWVLSGNRDKTVGKFLRNKNERVCTGKTLKTWETRQTRKSNFFWPPCLSVNTIWLAGLCTGWHTMCAVSLHTRWTLLSLHASPCSMFAVIADIFHFQPLSHISAMHTGALILQCPNHRLLRKDKTCPART